MRILVGVILVLVALAALANCSNPKPRYTPAPTPAPSAFTPRPYLTPDPADDVKSTEDTDDVHVDIDHEDDDRRNSRWCPTRWC